MIAGSMRVIFDESGGRALEGEDRFETFLALLEAGYAVTAADGRGILARAGGRTALLGCYGGAPPAPEGGLSVRDITGLGKGGVLRLVEEVRGGEELNQPGKWKPWFPVIDYDRCTNCMQCLSFCLFGVYGTDAEGRIQVQNQNQCKTDCPACSRVCPEVAIMFPKYRAGPINGEEVRAEDLDREKMKVDVSSLLGGDIYALLRDRSERAKSRFSRERDDERALHERKRCLKRLAESMEIPPEVLDALPGAEEIERRAAEARARAQEALESQ